MGPKTATTKTLAHRTPLDREIFISLRLETLARGIFINLRLETLDRGIFTNLRLETSLTSRHLVSPLVVVVVVCRKLALS